MNKDALLATAIGFVIGLCITGLLLVGPSLLQKLPKIAFSMPQLPKMQIKKQEQPATKQAAVPLTIDSPLNESIESQKELLLSGRAPSKSTIVIEANSSETAVMTTEDSKFAGKISLIEGKNDITVTSYTNGVPTSQSIIIYHTPEEL